MGLQPYQADIMDGPKAILIRGVQQDAEAGLEVGSNAKEIVFFTRWQCGYNIHDAKADFSAGTARMQIWASNCTSQDHKIARGEWP